MPTFKHERFDVVRVLGSGAMGHVYEVTDRERNGRLALKALRKVSPETVLLLKREFRAVQELNHRNLVQLGELYEQNGLLFFTMELVHGQDFTSYVRSRATNDNTPARCDYERLRACTLQLIKALGVLHRAGKVHLDVKPSNIVVEPDGRVVLLDFGVAADWGKNEHIDSGPLGTVPYMAPEQASGESLSPAADLYAVGCMLFECLTGRLPFEGRGNDVLEAKLTQEAPLASQYADDVPADLDALCELLLRSEPDERPSAEDVVTRLGGDAEAQRTESAMRDDVFVGRGEQLAALARAFDDSAKAAVTVVLRGQSGVGKSHLALHFVDSLRQGQRAPLMLWGKCFEREQLPYKGVDAVVDGLFESLNTLSDGERERLAPRDAALLARAFPVLAGMFAPDKGGLAAVVPEQLRRRTFGAFRELVGNLARKRPLVIVIDDIQWADADSLALLRALLDVPDAPAVLLCLLERWNGTDPQLVSLPGDVRRLDLSPLAKAEAVELARRLLGDREGHVDAERLAQITEDTQGHPLFITELARHRHEGSPIARGLDEVILARVASLAPLDRSVLEVVATAGYPLALDVLGSSIAASPRALFDVLVRLRNERLVRSDRDDRTVCAYHDRVRESVANHLDSAQRAVLHRELALALQALGRDDAEALARHWEAAGDASQAARYVRVAANKASSALAFSRTATLLEKLLVLEPMAEAQRTQVEIEIADAWGNAGYSAKSARLRLALAEHLTAEGAVDQRRMAAEELLTSGHFDESAALLERLVTDAELFDPKTPGRSLLGLLTRRLQLKLRGTSFKPCDPASIPARQRRVVDASWSAGGGLIMTDVIRGNYFLVVNALEALKLGEPERIVRALAVESMCGGAADRARSNVLIERARSVCQQANTPMAEAYVALGDGGLAYFWGECERAIPLLKRAEALFRDKCIGARYQLNSVRFMLCRVLAQHGALRELSELVPGYMREADERGDLYSLINLRSTPQAILELAKNNPAAASAFLDECDGTLTQVGFHVQHYLALIARVQVLIYQGQPEQAYAAIDQAWPQFKRSHLLRVPLIRIHSHDLLARAALATAARNKARQPELRKVVTRCLKSLAADSHHPWTEVPRHTIAGCAALLDSQRESAVSHWRLAQAAGTTHAMDMNAAALLLALGGLIGGDEGAALDHKGDSWLRGQGVVEPRKLAALLVPEP